MKSSHFRVCILIAASLAVIPVHANEVPQSVPVAQSPSAKAAAIAAANAQAAALAQGGNSRSNATGGTANAYGAAAAGDSSATGGSGVGVVEGDQNTYRSTAWALSLPGLVAAPAVPGQCLEHLRGWGAASIGATGRTKLNAECIKMVNCFAMADRYASWGKPGLAVAQLVSCGGVAEPATVTQETVYVDPAPVETVDPVTRKEMQEYVDRAFKTSVSK